MGLAKAYDYLSHDLLSANLERYGLDIGSSYGKWSEICRGILQGSLLGPLLFNIFIKEIFFFVEKSEICNFADDNTIYSCGKDLPKIKEDFICTMKNTKMVLVKFFKSLLQKSFNLWFFVIKLVINIY